MPSDRELLKLAGVELNDGSTFDTEEFSYTPAAKKPQWVSNSDADGDALVKEANYGPAYMEFTLRVAHQETADAAREALGELTDALQGCERTLGGAPLEWTPNDSETTYTSYALLAEYTAIPIVVQGDDAGWFLNTPRVKVKLTLRPFLHLPERTAKASTESSAAPLQEVFIKGIEGDVPAEARLILTDKATQNRRFAAWGRDVVGSEEPPAALITAASLTTTEFSGEAKTRSGAYSEEKVKRATAISSATTMCGTGRIKHIGSFAVYMRVYAGSENARFRISYRNGDGPLIPLKWVTPPVIENFSELYMGEVFLDAVELGTQTSEIRVEVKSAGASIELDVNYLILWPTKASLTARGRANNTPTKLLAYDEFLQTEGALSGKTLPVGGTWSGAGDATDFTVIAAEDIARRTATLDESAYLGRYALAGSEEPTTCTVRVDSIASARTEAEANQAYRGVIARYTNTENWLMAYLWNDISTSIYHARLVVAKRVAGTVTVLGTTEPLKGLPPYAWLANATVALSVAANGSWAATAYAAGGPEASTMLSGQDSVLATGGTLAKGKTGIYDVWMGINACTRKFDNFVTVAADSASVVCYSGKSIEFNSDGVLRQDSTGAYDGQPDLPRGANFFLEPEGDNGTINRLVMRMRRNDVFEEADANVSDKHAYEVKVVERFLMPR